MTGRGNPEGEEIKRERGKDKRHLGTEVERKKELQGLKPTIQHSIFLSFLFPRGDSCPVILLTDALLQALFPEVDRRNPSAAISSLPSPVAPLLMDCFSLRYVCVLWGQIFICKLAYVAAFFGGGIYFAFQHHLKYPFSGLIMILGYHWTAMINFGD